jgi:hypothetical protein
VFVKARLEKLASNKRSSLLRKFVNYGQKKFYNIGTSHTKHIDSLEQISPKIYKIGPGFGLPALGMDAPKDIEPN